MCAFAWLIFSAPFIALICALFYHWKTEVSGKRKRLNDAAYDANYFLAESARIRQRAEAAQSASIQANLKRIEDLKCAEQEKAEALAKVQATLDLGVKDWEAFRKPGETFKYLGGILTVKSIAPGRYSVWVARYSGKGRIGSVYEPTITQYPMLYAGFMNPNGDIRDYNFELSALPALKAQNLPAQVRRRA